MSRHVLPHTHVLSDSRLDEDPRRWRVGNTMYDARGEIVGEYGIVRSDGSPLYKAVREPRPETDSNFTPIEKPSAPVLPPFGAWLGSLDSKQRKEVAAARGFAAYFPDAIALVARHSARMNAKHNPGQPIHWSRGKSSDHMDCELRHLLAVATDPDVRDADGAYEIVCKAWRALADLQEWAAAKHARGEVIE